MIKRVLYKETQAQFARDVERNIVYQKMQHNAEESGIHCGENEIASWTNNAPYISKILYDAGVSDSYVTFEFLVPFSRKRIDCVIYGTGTDGSQNVIHIELKQWSNNSVKIADCEGNFEAKEKNEDVVFNVTAYTGHANRIVAHPSQQVKGYQGYLSNFIEVISNQELHLTGFAYCYNYLKNDPKNRSYLFDEQYGSLLAQYPTYSKDQKPELVEKLKQLLINGDGLSVFNKMMASPVRPSKKLLNEVTKMVQEGDTSAFSLIEDQIVARNIILDKIRPMLRADSNGEFQKSVIIVKGGPGTGKTVIALHIICLFKSVLFIERGGPIIIFMATHNNGPDAKVLIHPGDGSFQRESAYSFAAEVFVDDKTHQAVEGFLLYLRRIRFPGNGFTQEDQPDTGAVAPNQVSMADEIMLEAVVIDFHNGGSGIDKAFRDVIPVNRTGGVIILMSKLFKRNFHIFLPAYQ